MASLKQLFLVIGGLGLLVGASQAQEPADTSNVTLEVNPRQLTLAVGETATLEATVRTGDGTLVDDAAVVFFSRARRSVPGGVDTASIILKSG